MKLPSKKRPGLPILAKDWNLLIDALQARTPCPGYGTEIIATTAGFTFRIKPNGGIASKKSIPLTIIGLRPPYIAPPSPPPIPSEISRRYYIEWGTLNNLIAENWDDHFDVSDTTYFFAKATLRTSGSLVVAKWEIVTGPNVDSYQMPDWEVGANRPDYAIVLLGVVFVNDGAHSISQSGGGSLVISEHITAIEAGTSAGEIEVGKELTYHRLTY